MKSLLNLSPLTSPEASVAPTPLPLRGEFSLNEKAPLSMGEGLGVRLHFKSLLNLTVLMLLTFTGFSQDVNVRKKEFLLDKGTAISGYDPTAYFSGKAQKGKKEFSYTQEGVNYQFSNANNLENFKKNPAKYEPQYGGWCAYAMGAKGEKVEVDPETFKIINGKLYLYYHTFFSNTLTDWNKDENALKTKADANWTKFIKK